MWAEDGSYTITFGSKASSNTPLATTTGASTVISAGIKYVTNKPFTNIEGKAYYGDNQTSIRLGKSGNSASVTINLSEAGSVKAKSITVNCFKFNDSNTGRLTVNSLTAQSVPTSSASNLTFTFDSATDITNIVLAVTKATFIYSITVNYTTGPAASTTAAPTISGSETFFTTRMVTLTNDVSADGAAIYYTLNGSDPTTTTSETCFAYTAPFEISATTTVKAIAKHADDENASEVVSKTFTKQTFLEGITALNAAENGTYYVKFTDAQFTFFNGNQGYLNDADAGIIYYKSPHPELKTTYNGFYQVVKTVYKGMPELTNIIEVAGECSTTTPGELQAPVVLTVTELDESFDDHLARQIQINKYAVTDADALTANIAFYTTSPFYGSVLTVGKVYTLVGYPYNNDGTKQFRVVSAAEYEPVTISASGWTSLASAYALNYSGAEMQESVPVVAYAISSIKKTSVTLTQHDAAPAGVGMILKGNPGSTYSIPVTTSVESFDNKLSAAVTATAVEANSVYAVSGGKLKLFTGTEVPAGKAYLEATEVPAEAHGLTLDFDEDGETTGIAEISSKKGLLDGDFYDLSGRKVAQPTKGLYIMNGKKVIIK